MDTATTYLYCINLKDDISCNNFALPGNLSSTIFSNLFAFQSPDPTPLYTLNPDLLYDDPFQCFMGVVSPCSIIIMLAWYFRNNHRIINGYGQEMVFSSEDKNQIIFKANLEIAFEKERQKSFPTKPSRITSFFLAENNFEGRITLQNVFGDRTLKGFFHPFIMDVKIMALLFYHKADIRWLDEYVKSQDKQDITNYWKGEQFDHTERWEYVVEGMIQPADLEQIKELRKKGSFFSNSHNWWQHID